MAESHQALAASAFYYDYTDIQVTQLVALPNGLTGNQTVNAAESEIYGLALELRSVLTETLSVDFGLSWVPTADYEKFSQVDGKDFREFTRSGESEPIDLSGHRLNRTAEYSGTLGLNFNSALNADWSMDARLELYFTDDIAFQHFDRPNAYNVSIGVAGPEQKDTNIQDRYELLNLYLGFHYKQSWTVRAYGKNLTDEYYATGLVEINATGHTFSQLGRPLEAGVQLIYRFAN